MSDIIVITHEGDAHLEFVQRHLSSQLICIDPIAVVQGATLTFEPKRSVVTYKEKCITNVAAVWFRKPLSVRNTKIPVDTIYEEYSRESLVRHINNLKTIFPEALWVSDYYAILRAENKVWQLDLANRLGLRVPDTIITSSTESARKFIRDNQEVIVKFQSVSAPHGEGFSALASMKITTADFKDIQGLSLAPAIFQQLIKPKADVRVTVVGEKVFAALIEDPGVEEVGEIRDWRLAHLLGRSSFAKYAISNEASRLCVRLVKAMGLQFGALDFVLDHNNQLWFLEINSNGQWAFIEEDTGLSIGKAIAELLEHGQV